VSRGPSAAELLRTPGALLTRGDLRELGLERRAIDAVFRELPVIELPGYSRPMVRAEAYLALLDGCTYCDRCGDEVRPAGKLPGALPKERPDGAADTAAARTRARPARRS
jgi:hypothetical protein